MNAHDIDGWELAEARGKMDTRRCAEVCAASAYFRSLLVGRGKLVYGLYISRGFRNSLVLQLHDRTGTRGDTATPVVQCILN